MRQTIETARQSMGTAGRPFDYFVRPHTPDADDVDLGDLVGRVDDLDYLPGNGQAHEAALLSPRRGVYR